MASDSMDLPKRKSKIIDVQNDQNVHDQAIFALAHYYRHKDSSALGRIVQALPNSNRRVAMIAWIHHFTCLRWDRGRAVLVRTKNPEVQEISLPEERPFWIFKISAVRRRHVSGGEFDPDYFFDKVINDVRLNIKSVPPTKLDSVILELKKILLEMQDV